MKSIKSFEWLIHWVIVFLGLFFLNYPAFNLTFGVFQSGDNTLLWPSIVGTFFNLLLFYLVSFYLIPISLKRNVSLFIIQLLLLFVVISSAEIFIDAAFYKSKITTLGQADWSEIIVMVLVIHVLVVIIAFAYRFSRDWFANERLRRSISEHQLRSELEVLKSQINPHFLFNALNNLFSMALQSGDEKTAEGINKLSEMMRYVFDNSRKEKVSLREEVQYISDYIFLQQLRFDKQVNVQFEYPAALPSFFIAPMLLIPFVENAFKYGVSSQTNTIISIAISLEKGNFIFEVKNQKIERTETIPSSGMGIKNVQKRLELIYSNQHELTLTDLPASFQVKLIIFGK